MPRRSRSYRQSSRAARRKPFQAKGPTITGVILIIVVIVVAVIWANSKAGGSTNASGGVEISVDEAYEQYQRGAFLLDVREESEWNASHIPGAAWIPLAQLPARMNEVPRDRLVIVVCRSGNRSRSGANILLQAGFTDVRSMAGGMEKWISQGYPTTSP